MCFLTRGSACFSHHCHSTASPPHDIIDDKPAIFRQLYCIVSLSALCYCFPCCPRFDLFNSSPELCCTLKQIALWKPVSLLRRLPTEIRNHAPRGEGGPPSVWNEKCCPQQKAPTVSFNDSIVAALECLRSWGEAGTWWGMKEGQLMWRLEVRLFVLLRTSCVSVLLCVGTVPSFLLSHPSTHSERWHYAGQTMVSFLTDRWSS